MSLKKQAVSGVKWTAISAVLATFFQLLLVSILARLISKSDFGLMAIAIFITGFSSMFIDMGISNAIIYRTTITHKQLSSLYWVNVFTGILIYVIIILAAPAIAIFYNDNRLIDVLYLAGATFLIQPFGMQFAVLLRKEMNFKSLAYRDVASKFIGLIVGSILGYLGYGVYALVLSSLVSTCVSTVLLVLIGIRMHKPGFYFNYAEIKEFLSFGVFQLGEKMVNYFNTEVDSIIIGKFLGVESLGGYSIVKSFVMRPAQVINPIITKVSFPLMAKVNEDIAKVKYIYLKTLGLLSTLNFPLFLFMIFFAEPVVMIVFGKEWINTAVLLRILAAYALVRSTVNPIGSLQMARGRADLGFYWNMVLLIFVPLTVWIGSYWGIVGVCWAFFILQCSFSIPVWYFMVNKLSEASFKEYYATILYPLFIALVPALLVGSLYLFNMFNIKAFSSLEIILICCPLYGVAVILMNFLFNKEMLEEFRKLIKKN